MLIDRLSTGDKVYLYNKSIIIKFTGKRGVISTSVLNGGYSEEIEAVFNHDAKGAPGMGCKLKAPTYKEHMEMIAIELGLNPLYSTGIGTAADMENMSKVQKSYNELVVTALVTGGIETNGGRVGDEASYVEENSKIEMLKPGTINILVMIDGFMEAGILTRALVTATEAKTAAIQELLAGSNYSRGLATGSGTDGTIICSNLESDRVYTNAGKHSKLGELIGKAVKEAVKKALSLQSGLNPQKQKSILRRAKRFGITTDSLWNHFNEINEDMKPFKLEYMDSLSQIEKNEKLVCSTSLILHLLDQYDWKLLSENVVKQGIIKIFKEMDNKMEFDMNGQNIVDITIYNLKKVVNRAIKIKLEGDCNV